MTESKTDNRMLLAALWYARTGWPVLALHGMKEGACSCGSSDCDSPGKHPRFHNRFLPSGLNSATRDEDTVRRWWQLWPEANVGIVTGGVSGIVVLDIDPRNGGTENLAKLEAEHGRLPRTVQVTTGGDGKHFFFKHPGFRVKCRSGDSALLPGVELKGDGGYVVAPPSVHASGKVYAFDKVLRPDRVGLASPPKWLRAMLSLEHAERGGAPANGGTIGQGRRNETLASLAGTMRRRGMGEEAIAAALLRENATRCAPPLPDAEVVKIARSVSRYQPQNAVVTSIYAYTGVLVLFL